MQIFMSGSGERDFAPDQILAGVEFSYQATSYDEALKGGVEKVKAYIDGIAGATDFSADDFKTTAYSIREQFHYNRIEPKTPEDLDKVLEKRVSEGFFFTQVASLEFDYDKMRLAKLLAISSKIPGAPMLHVSFRLKDRESKFRELIPIAYEDAKKKAEALANAANKHLRDCVRVDIDGVGASIPMPRGAMMKDAAFDGAYAGASRDEFEEEIQNIDETFKPDDITLSKSISCVWETSD